MEKITNSQGQHNLVGNGYVTLPQEHPKHANEGNFVLFKCTIPGETPKSNLGGLRATTGSQPPALHTVLHCTSTKGIGDSELGFCFGEVVVASLHEPFTPFHLPFK